MERNLYILDLDRTLFDCDSFYIDICKILEKARQLTKKQLKEIIYLLDDPHNNPYIDDLIRQYQLQESWVSNAVELLKPNAYLYPDVSSFLRRMNKERIVIITTGIERFQKLKFQISPLLKSYTYQIIEEINKGEYIKEHLHYQGSKVQVGAFADSSWHPQIVLVDDRNYNLNALAGAERVTLFHIRRQGEKLRDMKLMPGITPIASLEEVE